MIESLSLRIAHYIKRANPDETVSVDIMKYSLMIILNGLSIALFSVIIGGITGKLPETVLTMAAFVLLRFFSGGRHLGSSDSCVFWSTLAMVSLPHIPVTSWMVWSMIVITMLIVLRFVPFNMHEQVRFPERYYPLLKTISFLLVSSNLIWFSAVIAKAFFLQSLFLIPFKGGEKNEKQSS